MNKYIALHILKTTPIKRSGFVYKVKEFFNNLFKKKRSDERF